MELSADQLERYSRNIAVSSFGQQAQKRLLRSRVLVIGAGGLGSPVCLYLAAAGVGTIGVLDSDSVSLSNLQRQILHRMRDIGKPKVLSACREMTDLNPDVRVIPLMANITEKNARSLVMQYDVVVAAVDNFSTRFVLNDACVAAGKPLVEAGVSRFDALLMTVVPGRGACYRCVFPDEQRMLAAPPASQAGVIGAVAGVAGCMQCIEVIKLLTGRGDPIVSRLLIFDGLAGSWREVSVEPNPECTVCAAKKEAPVG